MNLEPPPKPRKSLRLPEYDYSQPGAYFVTICPEHRLCLFGQVQEGNMSLSLAGQMITDVWLQIPQHYPGISVDSFVAMPNHVHGIVVLANATTLESRQPQGVAARGLSLPEVVDR